MIRIEIFNEGVRLPYKKISKKKIKDIALAAAAHLGIDDALITVIITSDSYIKEINKKYRKINSPTDVLSFSNRDFPFPPACGGREEMGDIFISMERAVIQAAEYDTDLISEVGRLLIHGILHLVGYDHERSLEDKAEMEKIEDRLLKIIAV